MIAILVVAHTPLATALVACAKHVLGTDPDVIALDIEPNECAQDCSPRVAKMITQADRGDGVLVLTDLPGASPSNISVKASEIAHLEGTPCCVLGGANAAMLLRAINYRQGSLEDVAASALAGATLSVLRVD